MGAGRGWFTGAGALGGISDGDGGAGAGGGVQFMMHLLSSSNSMILGAISVVGMLALLAFAVVRLICYGVGMLAVVAVRLICHILAPLASWMPHSMIVPRAS